MRYRARNKNLFSLICTRFIALIIKQIAKVHLLTYPKGCKGVT